MTRLISMARIDYSLIPRRREQVLDPQSDSAINLEEEPGNIRMPTSFSYRTHAGTNVRR